MAIDAPAIITFGFYPGQPLEFYDRVITFGWWDGISGTGPIIVDSGGTHLTVRIVGKHRL
jgi:hypothetical protein